MTDNSNILSDADLQAFLNELNLSTPELTPEDLKKLQQEEAEELEKLVPGNNLASDDAWGWSKQEGSIKTYSPDIKDVAHKTTQPGRDKSIVIRKEKAIEKKRLKQQIINEALNSNFIDLNAPLSVDLKKRLISLLTKDYTSRMETHERFINSTIEKALKVLIPHDLLNAFNNYPDTIAPFPGFTYQASKEYGQGLTFKVFPKIPLYFQPNDCNEILKKTLFNYKIATLDKTVALFYKYKEARSKQEIKIADSLVRVHTFFQLVKREPFWYDLLIQDIKEHGL